MYTVWYRELKKVLTKCSVEVYENNFPDAEHDDWRTLKYGSDNQSLLLKG